MVERPRLRVAGADVDESGLGVVRHAVPHRAAAAALPPLLSSHVSAAFLIAAFSNGFDGSPGTV